MLIKPLFDLIKRNLTVKITKTCDDVIAYNLRKAIANYGCHECPCCGETESALSHKNMMSGQGILHIPILRAAGGFFRSKIVKVDTYRCYTCGAEWESDQYD